MRAGSFDTYFVTKNGPYLLFFIERSVHLEKKFWCLQFFQKTNLEILVFALAGAEIFRSFLEELKNPKFLFKINWPLEEIKAMEAMLQTHVYHLQEQVHSVYNS